MGNAHGVDDVNSEPKGRNREMMKFVKALCVLLLLCPAFSSHAEDVLPEQAFTDVVVGVFRDQAPDFKVRVAGPLHLKVKNPEGLEFEVFLVNAYKTYQTSPESLSDIIATYTAGWLEPGITETGTLDASRIVPVIKDTKFVPELLQSIRSRGGSFSEFPVPAYQDYNSELVILFAEDTDRNIRYLSEEELTNNGYGKANRLARALENLRALLPDVELYGTGSVYQLAAGGDYDTSLLLFDRVWQNPQLSVRGELVVAVPARNTLVVTGSGDREGLAVLRRIISDVMQEDAYSLTDRLFVYRDGRFVLFN